MTAVNPPYPPPRTAPATATATATTANTSALPQSAAARQRLSHHNSGNQDASPSPRPDPLRRRSSLISYSSLEDLNQIVNPKTGRTKDRDEDNELTHWHSSPLAFAILPALGGLVFQNGSAFVTDVLLLGLAAIFMNWSIRLPWDWYYSAQTIRYDAEPDADDLDDETAIETGSSAGGSPRPSPNGRVEDRPRAEASAHNTGKREEAVAELRRQERLALAATFLFPVGAAYLLHVIRAQLSRPSTGLVSDYNLCIFLLAAEIRPVRQLVRLAANRTLHLQRTVTGISDPFSSALEEKSTLTDFSSRVAELEEKLSTQANSNPTTAQKTDVSDLSKEMQKRYEPRFDGLERAVRRYEKRSITLAQVTEQRLQSLEARLQEALSLAAVAAQHSQDRGTIAKLLETISNVIAWAMNILLNLTLWPFRTIDDLYIRMKTLLLGPVPPRVAKRKARQEGSDGREDRSRDRAPANMRKIVR
ncbi:hypothetical protein DOTSEDRAFT_72643 [Dothistroma septosporum NZE10]|uniref:Uncharacterized protein n=1 Tax=Dothistroma septosporum (strain NZE10 / CBS 128990) TaxID=675120 RepID=M2WMQ6_DOTSN|nr:hypothetical protein DOTSEDRAFT_72643 [Dothistroma septosporum NZE10]